MSERQGCWLNGWLSHPCPLVQHTHTHAHRLTSLLWCAEASALPSTPVRFTYTAGVPNGTDIMTSRSSPTPAEAFSCRAGRDTPDVPQRGGGGFGWLRGLGEGAVMRSHGNPRRRGWMGAYARVAQLHTRTHRASSGRRGRCRSRRRPSRTVRCCSARRTPCPPPSCWGSLWGAWVCHFLLIGLQ